MKTNFLKISLLTLLFGAFSMFTLTSCDKDDDTTPDLVKTKIVGTWDFTSFKVGTSEYMGTIVDSASVTFEAYTGAQGDFEQTLVYADGEQEEISGKYNVDEAKKEVKMIADGETEIVKISFTSSDKMEWKTTQDGKQVVAKTERRD
jgi:hypothetical protein